MIQSLLIANRGEIACRIIRAKILPGTGRCPVRAEGSHFEVCSAAEMWDPSVGFAATSPDGGGILNQSLLIANRGEVACRMFRPHILPGTGRGTAFRRWRGETSRISAIAQRWNPSVSPADCHLPVSGRN